MLASPLLYSGQLSREDYELRLAHPSGHSELRFIYLCSSLILLYPAIEFSHTIRTIQVRTLRLRMATNKICFKVRAYNVPDNLYDRGKKML